MHACDMPCVMRWNLSDLVIVASGVGEQVLKHTHMFHLSMHEVEPSENPFILPIFHHLSVIACFTPHLLYI